MRGIGCFVVLVWLLASCCECVADEGNPLDERFERMAEELTYFSATEFAYGQIAYASEAAFTGSLMSRPPRLSEPASTTAARKEYQRNHAVVSDLISHSFDPIELTALLQHDDAKVRSLAAAALFATDDPHHLPAIARLTDDRAPTFPGPREPDAFGRRPLLPQTVRDVARAFLRPYKTDSRIDFAEEWRRRGGRAYTCVDFYVQMYRAHGADQALADEQHSHMTAVRERIKRLPMPDRAWILMALWEDAHDGSTDRRHADGLTTEAEVVEAARALGPDRLLRALDGDIDTDDPTLQPRTPKRYQMHRFFNRMLFFVLRRPEILLRADDADALLEIEGRQRERYDRLRTSSWATSAARLKPERAVEILRPAFARFDSKYDLDRRCDLAANLWQLGGEPQGDYLVEWFYEESSRSGQFGVRGLTGFLRRVAATTEPDGRAMIARIVADPRFDDVDWRTTRALLEIFNHRLADPVVPSDDIRDLGHPMSMGHFSSEREMAATKYPEETRAVLATLADWRARLRRRLSEFWPTE